MNVGERRWAVPRPRPEAPPPPEPSPRPAEAWVEFPPLRLAPLPPWAVPAEERPARPGASAPPAAAGRPCAGCPEPVPACPPPLAPARPEPLPAPVKPPLIQRPCPFPSASHRRARAWPLDERRLDGRRPAAVPPP